MLPIRAADPYTNFPTAADEPAGHGIGRSHGGLSTKIYHDVDGHGRPLAIVAAPGQGHDASMLATVLTDIYVPRSGKGRPRTTPDAVLGDKAYSSRGMLTERGIYAVIPESRDQRANRTRRGSRGGCPISYARVLYKNRNVVERSFAVLKKRRVLATRYDKHAVIYRGAAVLGAILVWLPY